MAVQTVHLVQAFIAGRGKALKSEQAVVCKTAEEAMRRAEGDMDMGDFDETPTILFKSGRLPPPFEEAWVLLLPLREKVSGEARRMSNCVCQA